MMAQKKSRSGNMRYATILLIALCSTVDVRAQSSYDEHVAFDNSLTTPEYFYSSGDVVAPS